MLPFFSMLVPWFLLALVLAWLYKKFSKKAILVSAWFIFPLILTLWMFILQIAFIIFTFKQFHEFLFILGFYILFKNYLDIILLQNLVIKWLLIADSKTISSVFEVKSFNQHQSRQWLLLRIIAIQNILKKLKIKKVLSPPTF
ncbi:hypothetical protein [Spiroplasma sp. SV19]|uniref:hypothetical protein n=1 Tax=Spiroplasma sp. SV19 TaxID=2570468 RepID=UPI0024B7235E|nr:hypothetical protein [Spiroplasma sp. SV19]